MKVYFDENMPFAAEFFEEFGDLVPFEGRSLTSEMVKDADVLLVRSITKVNEELLSQNNKLSFVGTATIGFDHIDREYLSNRGVSFHSSPGCNAVSVAEYVLSSLIVLAERYQLNLFDMTVGIIGAGNTGTQLSEKLTAINIKHVFCDPPLSASEKDPRSFVTMEEALKCDVISLHVPKIMDGEHPTFHLINETTLNSLRNDQILINACRGEIIDNQALLKVKQNGHMLRLVLDVWENEPNILTELIPHCDISTAHIAGYSLEGKARGTEMLYLALCQQRNIVPGKLLNDFLPSSGISKIEINQEFNQVLLNQLVKIVYDVRRDDGIFREQIKRQFINGHAFDNIRKTYPARREFSAVSLGMTKQIESDIPYRLGFSKSKN